LAVNERLDPVGELDSCLRWKELMREVPEGTELPYEAPVDEGDWEWDDVGR